MDLQRITYILIVSFVASFAIRIIGTSFPIIFQNSYVVKITIVTHSFFMMMQLLFFVYFLFSYANNREPLLKFVSFLASLGSFSVLFLYTKNFGRVFEMDIYPLFFKNSYLDAFLPLVSSTFHLLFFGIFKNLQTNDERVNLNRSILSAVIGVGIFIILHLIVLINLLKHHRFNWIEHMSRLVAVCTLPLIAIAGILVVYFYIKFYQFVSSLNNKSKEINNSLQASK